MPQFLGRQGWCIELPELDTVYSNLSPGPVKGDIVVEHNSLGATTGGSFTAEGYLSWAPYSTQVRIYVGSSPVAANRIGWAVLGVPTTTVSATGQRTTTLPLVSFAEVESGGLLARGTSTFTGVNMATLYLGAAAPPTVEFGMTWGEYYGKMIEALPLGSWGVTVDGRMTVGTPSAAASVLSVDATRPNCLSQPSGYEIPEYVTEYQWRAGERWIENSTSRARGPYIPRKSAAISDEDLLEDVQASSGPPLVSLVTVGNTVEGGLYGVVDLRSFALASHANPKAVGATYEGVAVTVDVTLNATGTGGDQPPPTWPTYHGYSTNGTNPGYTGNPDTDDRVDIWASYNAYQKGPEGWRYNRYADQADEDAYNAAMNDRNSPANRAKAAADFEQKRQEGWKRTRDGASVSLTWAEWLTSQTSVVGSFVSSPSTPVKTLGDYPPPISVGRAVASFPFAEEVMKDAWVAYDYATYRTTRQELKPETQPGFLRLLASQTTTMNTGNRKTFAWRFSAPEALIKQVDPTLPLSYYWAFAVAWSATTTDVGVDLQPQTVRIHRTTPTRAVNVAEQVPGFTAPYVSPQTYQGSVEGELFCGPALVTVEGGVTQYATQTRMVIGTERLYTEFQTGARQF